MEDTSGFCTSVAWMKNRGITLGCTSTSLYCPGDFVRRDQMAAFMYRLGFQNAFLNGGNGFAATAVLGTTDNEMLELRASGEAVMRFQPTDDGFGGLEAPNVIGGHGANHASPASYGQTIGGGGGPGTSCYEPATGTNTRVCRNETDGHHAAVSGGHSNWALAPDAFVGGGFANTASGWQSTVGGGYGNKATGTASAAPGGAYNTAAGDYSFGVGIRAKATHDRSFVWGGNASADTGSTADGEFVVSAPGGIRLNPAAGGCTLTSGASGWACVSDRTVKSDIVAADGADMLRRVIGLPIARWSFTAAPGIAHMGPMAQDFHLAFGLGDDPTRLAPMDVQGVALAAIQGLNSKLEVQVAAKDAEIAALRSESEALKRDIADLRLAVEVLMARTTGEGRIAQTR